MSTAPLEPELPPADDPYTLADDGSDDDEERREAGEAEAEVTVEDIGDVDADDAAPASRDPMAAAIESMTSDAIEARASAATAPAVKHQPRTPPPERDSIDRKLAQADEAVKIATSVERVKDLQERRAQRKQREAAAVERTLEKHMENKRNEDLGSAGTAGLSRADADNMRAFREWQRYREELGLRGTGKNITLTTPLKAKLEEVAAMKMQAAELRAGPIVSGGLDFVIARAETFVSKINANYDATGFAAVWAAQKKENLLLRDAVKELEIELAPLFTVSAKQYVIFALVQAFTAVVAKNYAKKHGVDILRANDANDASGRAAPERDVLHAELSGKYASL